MPITTGFQPVVIGMKTERQLSLILWSELGGTASCPFWSPPVRVASRSTGLVHGCAPEAHRARRPLSPNSVLFAFGFVQPLPFPLQAGRQLFQAGHAQQVKLNQFHHPLAGPLAGVELQQQRRNQRQVNLQGHPLPDFRPASVGSPKCI